MADPGGLARRGSSVPRVGPQRVRWGRGPARWEVAARGSRRSGTLPCCPPLPGAAAGSARWRTPLPLRDSALPGEVGLATSPARLPQGTWLWGGVHGLAELLEPSAFLSRSFLFSRWRRRRNGEGAGTRGFVGPSLTPPLPGAQIVLEASSAPPQCPDAGAVGGLRWRPLPLWRSPTHVRQ